MNYYEFYDLTLSFHPDKKIVRKKYIQISKACHPDFFAADSSINQEQALQKSSFNNEAFDVLSNDRKRIKYVLSLLIDDSIKKQVPPDFLMEMMEVNEQVMMLSMDQNKEAEIELKKTISSINTSLNEQLNQLTNAYDTKKDSSLLASIQEVLMKLQYMDRLVQNSQLFS